MIKDIIERVPPHSLEAEHSVLGAMLVDNSVIDRVSQILHEANFYRPSHGLIFAACVALRRRRMPVDLITVRDELGEALEAAGGYGYLVDIAAGIPTTAHAVYHSEIIAEKAARRSLIALSQEMANAAFTADDAAGTIASAVIAKLLATRPKGLVRAADTDTIAEAVIAQTRAMMERRQRGEEVTAAGITTGLANLDKLVLIGPGDLFVIGATPSSGKTALAIGIARAASWRGPVFFASAEQRKEAVVRRMLAQETGINSRSQRNGDLTEQDLYQLASATHLLGDNRIVIDDTPKPTVAHVRAGAQALQAEDGLACIVVDHMSKLRGSNPKHDLRQEMTQISGDVHAMGVDLGVPVIALAQLSREVAKDGRKPRMSDLRESGAVEQDADIIGLLHRPERRGSWSEATLDIVKQREGPCDEVTLYYDAARTLFKVPEVAKAPGVL